MRNSAADRVQHWLKRIEENPDSAPAHFNLGLAYTQQGRMESAEGAYRKALALDPDMVEAWVNLGGVLLLRWDFEGCLEATQEALKRKGDSFLAHYNMGQAYLYRGDCEGVVRCSRRAVELDQSHAGAHYYLAVGLLAMDRVEEAQAELGEAMKRGHRPTPEFLNRMQRVHQRACAGDAEMTDIPGSSSRDNNKED